MIMKHFVFGYGSLICPQSRVITAPTLEDAIAEPVVIEKIERTWSARVTKKQARSSTGEDLNDSSSASNGREHIRGWTPMGVRFRPGAKCNGVLIHVDEEELGRFDVRESGYVRQTIELADIHRHVDSDKLIDGTLPLWPTGQMEVDDDGVSSTSDQLALDDVGCSECRLVFEKASAKRRQASSTSSLCDSTQECDDIAVWVYVQSEDLPAERSFPIPQSYVDIIMRGCLSISNDFARRFLESTHGWWHDGLENETALETDNAKKMKDEPKTVMTSSTKEGQLIEKHHTWINDRHDPMYVRADSEYSLENGDKIDELIKDHHPHALQRRVVSM
mmetsp:Transcript_27072/g.43992  ORF Transcript_27072/g.43992 Transcript_27072/m.43992 type:complete len:333 (-) Transcript_27072:112-1110(-)